MKPLPQGPYPPCAHLGGFRREGWVMIIRNFEEEITCIPVVLQNHSLIYDFSGNSEWRRE